MSDNEREPQGREPRNPPRGTPVHDFTLNQLLTGIRRYALNGSINVAYNTEVRSRIPNLSDAELSSILHSSAGRETQQAARQEIERRSQQVREERGEFTPPRSSGTLPGAADTGLYNTNKIKNFQYKWQQRPEAGKEETALAGRGAAAADKTRSDLLARTELDTSKTPEEQRTEYFQRLADIENARMHYRPSVTRIGAGTGSQVVQEGGAYQMPQLEFEDMRQQMINRARRGDKLAYNELGRIQEANEVLYKLRGMAEMNAMDLDKLKAVNAEALRQMMDVTEVQLRADLRRLESDVEAQRMFRMAEAEMGIAQEKLMLMLRYMADGNYATGAAIGDFLGLGMPGFMARFLGQLVTDFQGDRDLAAAQRARVSY